LITTEKSTPLQRIKFWDSVVHAPKEMPKLMTSYLGWDRRWEPKQGVGGRVLTDGCWRGGRNNVKRNSCQWRRKQRGVQNRKSSVPPDDPKTEL